MGLVLFFGLFYVVILGSLAGVGWAAHRSRAAALWPTTRGVVRDLSLSYSQKYRYYGLTVRYAYAVEGTEYVGRRVAFGPIGNSRTTAARIYKRLKRSTSVEVRYNPAKPSECCLTFGWHSGLQSQLLLLMMGLAFITGFVMLVITATGGDGRLVHSVLVN